MEHIDPDEPIFYIYANDRRVAIMFDPRFEDMFWCSYRLEPVDGNGDLVIHDDKTWERVAFVVKNIDEHVPNPHTFSGGFKDFCDRKTDRLSFRSLWPPRPPRPSLGARIFTAVAALVGCNQDKQNRTE